MGIGVLPLSGSTNGQPILCNGSDLVHQAPATTTTSDQVYIWLCNSTGAQVKATVYFGGGTANEITLFEYIVAPNSRLVMAVPGWIVNNSLPIYVNVDVASILTVVGFVVRFITGT